MDPFEKAGKYIADKQVYFKFENGNSIKAADEEIQRFQKKYSPEVLHSTPKNEVYKKFFRLDDSSMIKEMRQRKTGNIMASLGTLSQFGNNFPFESKGSLVKVGKGMPEYGRVVSREHACELGYELIRGLADCADYIKENSLSSLDDYLKFESFAEKKLKSQVSRDWVHKYLSLLYPDIFSEFHGNDFRKKLLNALCISPEQSIFGKDWQCMQIKKYSGIEHPYEFAHVVYSIKEVNAALREKTGRVLYLSKM